jgi:hypothetical protein
MVSIPLRSNIAKARFSVTVRRIIGAIYAKKSSNAISATGLGLKDVRSVALGHSRSAGEMEGSRSWPDGRATGLGVN